MNIILIFSYLLFSIISFIIYKTILFPFVFFFYVCIGLLLIKFIFSDKQQKQLAISLFLLVFLIYSLWGFLCRYFLISNPTEQFFLQPDQIFFFNNSIELSFLSLFEMLKEIFTNFKYSELPLNMSLLALKTKLLWTSDLNLLFQLLTLGSAFKGSLISVLILKLFSQFDLFDNKSYKATLIFSLFSCVFIHSLYLMRDIDITLLFVVMAIVVCLPRRIYHYIFLVLLIVVTYYVRQENGLFSLIFLLSAIYIDGKNNKYLKFFIYIIILILIGYTIIFILPYLQNTLYIYNSKSATEASSYSFGMVISKFPKPFNYLLQTVFGQILPFPFYCYSIYPEVIFEWIEWVNPFYWLYIWLIIIFMFFKTKILSYIQKNILILLIISCIYVFMVSIGQTGVRRQMPVYPFIFFASFSIGKFYSKKLKYSILLLSVFIICVLHIIYWVLKF